MGKAGQASQVGRHAGRAGRQAYIGMHHPGFSPLTRTTTADRSCTHTHTSRVRVRVRARKGWWSRENVLVCSRGRAGGLASACLSAREEGLVVSASACLSARKEGLVVSRVRVLRNVDSSAPSWYVHVHTQTPLKTYCVVGKHKLHMYSSLESSGKKNTLTPLLFLALTSAPFSISNTGSNYNFNHPAGACAAQVMVWANDTKINSGPQFTNSPTKFKSCAHVSSNSI